MAKASSATGTAGRAAGKTVRVTLIRSGIGFNKTQKATIEGLGLRRLNHSVELADTAATRGMIHKVRHLVVVSE
jgi:large subunit ribosomal protein L30